MSTSEILKDVKIALVELEDELLDEVSYFCLRIFAMSILNAVIMVSFASDSRRCGSAGRYSCGNG